MGERDSNEEMTKWIPIIVEVKYEGLKDVVPDPSACIIVFGFNDSINGKLAWAKWSKMTDEQKAATKLFDLQWGGKVFLLPGMYIAGVFPNGETFEIEPPGVTA